MIDLARHGEAVLQQALANGGPFGEIYLEERTGTAIRLDDNKIDRVVTGTDLGAAIRVVTGDRTRYAHSGDVSLEGLLRTAETVSAANTDPKGAYSFDFRPERFATPVKRDSREVATAEKIRMAEAANKAARACDPRVVQVTITCRDSTRRVIVANSDGRLVEDERPRFVFMVQVVAAQDDVIQTGLRCVGGAVGFELFDEEDPESLAREAANQAILMLEADPAPTGRMPVVLSGEAGGVMIHEAVGHGLEADLVDKGMSKYGGRLGETVAVDEVTVVDDGTLPGKHGTGSVDDEGTPAQRTVLIEQGRLVRFMNDLRTSRKMGVEPTGNGRRQSYQDKPIPRMTNTMILAGTSDPAGLLSATERGLFVQRLGGGQVNTLNGDYVFEVAEGYLIEHGKAEKPVRGAALVGNGPETLLGIEGVGSDVGFDIGWCGKDGQSVPISSGQPTLRIREMTVGGTAQ